LNSAHFYAIKVRPDRSGALDEVITMAAGSLPGAADAAHVAVNILQYPALATGAALAGGGFRMSDAIRSRGGDVRRLPA
jgi:hypothetical protein